MTDVLLLAVVGAFFALALLYVRACDRLAGTDVPLEPEVDAADDRDPARPVAA